MFLGRDTTFCGLLLLSCGCRHITGCSSFHVCMWIQRCVTHNQWAHLIFWLPPLPSFFPLVKKIAAWAWMRNRQNPFCSEQNFKLAQCVLFSLFCWLIKEIIKLEIRGKKNKVLSWSVCFPPVSSLYYVSKLCFAFLTWHWFQQNLLVSFLTVQFIISNNLNALIPNFWLYFNTDRSWAWLTVCLLSMVRGVAEMDSSHPQLSLQHKVGFQSAKEWWKYCLIASWLITERCGEKQQNST